MKLRSLRPIKIDFYLFQELLSPFLGACGFFFFIFFVLQVFRLANFVIVHQIPIGIVLKIAIFLLIGFANFVFPTAFLSGVIVAFGRLSTESEIIALKSMGVSLFRITRPALVLATMLAIVSLAMNMVIAPWGERSMAQLLYGAGTAKSIPLIQAGSFIHDFYDLIFYAEEVDQTTGGLKRVFLYDARQPGSPSVIVAPEGRMQAVATKDLLSRRILLRLQNGTIDKITDDTNSAERVMFKEYKLFLSAETPEFILPGDTPRFDSYQTVLAKIASAEKNSIGYYDYMVELWKRISLSLSPFVFVFLGIGLGTQRQRSAGSAGILMTLVVAILYWVLILWGNSLTFSGTLPAPLAMEIPNIAVGIIAIYFFRRAAR